MSNSNKVYVDKIDYVILEQLQNYKEDIEKDVIEVSNEIIKEARNELKQIWPKSNKNVYTRKGSVSGKKGDVITARKLCKILEYKKWRKD